MKKFMAVILATMMFVFGSGFTSARAVDNSALIEELQDEGFVQRGDVWTYETYDEKSGDGFIEWAVAYFDVVDNHGVMTYYAHEKSDHTDAMVCRAMCLEVAWDYEAEEFVILSQKESAR